ncbi:MAG: xylose isomerase, partial [Exiguobacterium mexicanum]
SGGLNFDAKVRRGSFEPEDLFYAHIAGMDSFAVGAKVAQRLIDDRVFENVIQDRYASYNEGIGKDIVSGQTDFHKLEAHAFTLTDIQNKSGHQEQLRHILNQYLLDVQRP